MKKLFFVLALLVLASCTSGHVNPFYLKTVDGVRISANYYSANSSKGVILLHMLGRDKSDWADFVPLLVSQGYDVISIDMRGHGSSDMDWKDMSGVELSRSVADVEAARAFLAEQGVSDFAIIGASIGANIALKYASQESSIDSVVLLSPSLDYRGVKTFDDMDRYDRAVFVVTSKEDSQSADDSLVLYEMASGTKKFMIYDGSGHGTQLLTEPTLTEMILVWLNETV